MDIKEIYLLTAFVCAACDGEIAPEELSLVKKLCDKSDLFEGLNVEDKLNTYVVSINEHGIQFINEFLRVLGKATLTTQEQLEIVKIAIEMIEADNQVLYSEVKFFKKLRQCLKISDEEILAELPDKEYYLLPDIKISDYTFDENVNFDNINLASILKLDKASQL